MKTLITSLFVALMFMACSTHTAVKPQDDFIKVNAAGQLVKHNIPYYYIGANFWYGAILGSQGEGGDRERLHRELDNMKRCGINNLRILVGADGENGVKTRVEPALQTAPGEYNDAILDGLDYLMNELRKRDMYAVLYLNNSWEWSGGYSVYLQWTGHGQAVVPAIDGWPAYFEYVKQFHQSPEAKELFAQHVTSIVTRTNRYNGLRYADDATLMAWQIGNEPRAFSDENKAPFAAWIASVAAQIKALDPNHLISVGSEGSWGCENDIDLFETLHKDANIDYLTIHIWPYNWQWAHPETLQEDLPTAIANTDNYIDNHLAVAERVQKPVVIEEFGFPRDGMQFGLSSTTQARDAYYAHVFARVATNAKQAGKLAGCNIWGWGGEAQPIHLFWEKGDPYTGDPAQEEQGLNSVFLTDESTVATIAQWNEQLFNNQ